MTGEHTRIYEGAGPLYVLQHNQSTPGTVWSTVVGAFVAYVAGSVSNYDVALAQQSGHFWSGDISAGIPAGTVIRAEYFEQAGVSPNATNDFALGSETLTVGESVEGGSGTATYNLSTDIGKLRLEIGDTDVVPSTDAIFLDEELQVFLDRVDTTYVDTGMEPCVAAGYALLAMASSAAWLAKSLRTMQFAKDTRGQAKALQDLAKEKFKMGGLPASGIAAAYAVAEMAVTPMNEDAIIWNKGVREN